jgi:hypothetical protein
MYPQQPFAEPGMYGTTPLHEGMYAQPPGMYPQQPSMFQQGPFPGTGQKGFPQAPQPFTGSLIGEGQYNIDARLDRMEREIVEINRRLNSLTRQVRRMENFLNIRD